MAKVIKKGEQGTKSTVVDMDTRIATCDHMTAHPSLAKGSAYQLRWMVDFSNIDEAEVIKMAAEHVIIKARRGFTGDEKADPNAWDNISIDANDYVTRRVDKKAKLAKAFNALSDEDKAALLAMIND